MRVLVVTALTVLLSFTLSHTGQAQEVSADFSGGSVLIGYDNRSCVESMEGAVRYDSAGNTSGQYCPNGVTFDGTSDYLSHNSDYTGLTDGRLWTGSFWFKRNGGLGAYREIYNNNSGRTRILIFPSDQVGFRGEESGASTKVEGGANTVITDSNWHHMMFSIDLTDESDTSKRHVYIDGIEDAIWTNWDDAQPIDFANGDHFIGANDSGGDKFIGDIADL